MWNVHLIHLYLKNLLFSFLNIRRLFRSIKGMKLRKKDSKTVLSYANKIFN